MDEVTVRKDELITTVQANRDAHRSLFLKAQEGYRIQVMELLEARLADARAGKTKDMYIHLSEPHDHTKEYDRVLKMLSMEIEPQVKIGARDFARYVMDDWEWKDQWIGSNSAYLATIDSMEVSK